MSDLDKKDKNELVLAKEWMDEAKKCTLETLPAFIEKMSKFDHGYGTICRAIAAAGVAAMHAVDRSPNGGVTGFQAGCIMWDVIAGWGTFDDGPKKMVQFGHMLYPQYEDHFEKTISQETWDWMQAEAKKKLDESNGMTSGTVVCHWKDISDGKVPFGYMIKDD